MKPDTSKSTILVICMGFLIVYFFFEWKWSLYTSLIIGVLSMISSLLSNKIEWVWMKLSVILGYIIPNILLTIVFFVFLLPIALASRLAHKDPLRLSRKYKSYFSDVNKQMDQSSFEKTW